MNILKDVKEHPLWFGVTSRNFEKNAFGGGNGLISTH